MNYRLVGGILVGLVIASGTARSQNANVITVGQTQTGTQGKRAVLNRSTLPTDLPLPVLGDPVVAEPDEVPSVPPQPPALRATTVREQPAARPQPALPATVPAARAAKQIDPHFAIDTGVANGSANAAGSLSLADLEALALQHNPTIPAAASSLEQRRGALQQAGLYPNPTVGYVRTDSDQTGQGRSQGVFVSQDIVTARKLKLAEGAAAGEFERTDWNLQAQRIRVINDVRLRYYDFLGAQQAVKGVRELTRLADDAVKLAETLLKAKQGSRVDVLQAELQLTAVQSSLKDAEYRYESAWRHLAAIIGLPNLQPAAIRGELDAKIPEIDYDAALQRLIANSPLMAAQQAEINASQYDLKLAKAQAVPNVNIQLVAERDYIQNYSSVSTLVSLPVPFFNRNQGNIYSSRARLDQQIRELDRVRLTLIDQFSASYRDYRMLRSQAERLKKDILPRAKENLDLTVQAYKAQHFDLFRVMAAQQFYFKTRLAYIDAVTELHKTVTEIEGLQLTGGLNPTEAGAALQGGGMRTTGARSILLQQLQEQQGGGSTNLPGALQSR